MIINMLPTEDIIPITYMGGTGGYFLCHLIVSAKRNIKNVLNLSEHGNSHKGMKDLESYAKGLDWPDQDKIDQLLSQLSNSYIEKPGYVPCHMKDINLINNTFKKSIRIVYDLDDVEEIANAYYGKWVIDCATPPSFKYTKESHAIAVRKHHIYFSKIPNTESLLVISWKELFKGNIEELIAKISMFTHINIEHFSKEILIHWRNKTQYCIDKFKDIR